MGYYLFFFKIYFMVLETGKGKSRNIAGLCYYTTVAFLCVAKFSKNYQCHLRDLNPASASSLNKINTMVPDEQLINIQHIYIRVLFSWSVKIMAKCLNLTQQGTEFTRVNWPC